MIEILLWLLAVVLVLIGIAGVILPALPGTPFVFLGLLVAAYIEHFSRIGWPTLTILGVLTLIATAVDFFAASIGAKRVGASPQAVGGASLGAVIGIFFGLPGLFFGPFIGAVIGEYKSRPDLIQAGRAGLGTWLGIFLGMALKIALVFTMLGVFLLAYFI